MANATNFSSSGADTENIGVIITKTTICMFLLALSLAENSLVLLIFKLNFRNRLRSTNCYFIANMSLADLLFAVQNLPHAYNNFVMQVSVSVSAGVVCFLKSNQTKRGFHFKRHQHPG